MIRRTGAYPLAERISENSRRSSNFDALANYSITAYALPLNDRFSIRAMPTMRPGEPSAELSEGERRDKLGKRLGEVKRASAMRVILIATIAAAAHGQPKKHPPKGVGDGGPAIKAQLNAPSGVAVGDGYLYIYESFGEAIRRVDLAKGMISTVARGCDPPVQNPPPNGCFGPLTELQINSGGKLLLSEFTYDRLSSLDPRSLHLSTIAGYTTLPLNRSGLPAPLTKYSGPHCSTTDDKGNIFICDAGYYIRRIDGQTGAISIVAGSGKRGFAGDHGPAIAAELGLPISIVVNRAGDIFISDDTSNRIRRVDGSGIIETIAGSGPISQGSIGYLGFGGEGGPATEARLAQPRALAFDQDENLLFVVNTRVCRIDRATGALSTIAGNGQDGFSGDGGPATKARIGPDALAVDRQGNLFIAEFENNRVRRVDAKTGIITTVAGNGLPHRPPPVFY
jgi:DNA-binding beta-propeller fold protein YncE